MNSKCCTVVLVALFACSNALVILPDQKIAGGTDADILEAPYMAAVLIDSEQKGVYSQACGGVIVKQNAVLTSAQCTKDVPDQFIRVRVGSTYHNSGGKIHYISSYKIHESFSEANFDNDLSILRMSVTINLGITVATITLPPQGADIIDGSNFMIYGWGRLFTGGAKPDNLKKASIPVVNRQTCASAYSRINTVTTNMICVGRYLVGGGVGPCQGDTGGPLVFNGTLYGISSWGLGCGHGSFPSVYTRISMYRTWLDDNL